MAQKIYNVLFICIGNSARSIMAVVNKWDKQPKIFYGTYLLLQRRLAVFCSLLMAKLDAMTIKRHIGNRGRLVHEMRV